jgi:hypothetical protein
MPPTELTYNKSQLELSQKNPSGRHPYLAQDRNLHQMQWVSNLILLETHWAGTQVITGLLSFSSLSIVHYFERTRLINLISFCLKAKRRGDKYLSWSPQPTRKTLSQVTGSSRRRTKSFIPFSEPFTTYSSADVHSSVITFPFAEHSAAQYTISNRQDHKR